MKLDAATHARLALVGLLGIALACAAASMINERPNQRASNQPADLESGLSGFPFPHPTEVDAGHLALLEKLRHRAPAAAELKEVFGYLDHPNWEIARRAHQVLKAHCPSKLAEAQLKLLERSIAEAQPPVGLHDFEQHRARVATLHEVLESSAPPPGDSLRKALVQLVELGPDGRARSRALELLATRPPAAWQRQVLRALDDPSERVRLIALDLISANGWTEAAVAVEPLASSARPTLRRRAAELLGQFGHQVHPIEYGESVGRAAVDLADQLLQAGIEPREVILAATRVDDADAFSELLHRHAEDYLDRGSPVDSGTVDAHGIMYLAVAARVGQRKLAVRLWEHEISRCDTDEEMLDRALECWARNRIVAGLACYEKGNTAESLQALTSVANIVAAAGRSPSLQVYVRQSGMLSAAIWELAVQHIEPHPSVGQPNSADPVARLATRLLNRLDLANPDHRAEAYRRIDAWCGLAPAAPGNGVHRSPLAN